MRDRLSLRRLALTATLLVLLAFPGVASAHPADAYTAPHQEPKSSDGGGTSPLLIGGIVVGVIATAGALYAVKQVQQRADTADSPATAEPAAPKQAG